MAPEGLVEYQIAEAGYVMTGSNLSLYTSLKSNTTYHPPPSSDSLPSLIFPVKRYQNSGTALGLEKENEIIRGAVWQKVQ